MEILLTLTAFIGLLCLCVTVILGLTLKYDKHAVNSFRFFLVATVILSIIFHFLKDTPH